MKKFKATVTKTYQYEIEIDEKVWTDEGIRNWASVFQSADSLEELIEVLASMKTRYEDGEFMEGFGIPYINGKAPYVSDSNRSSLCPDINIIPIQDGDDYPEVDVEEIE